ncbi:MAG: hypothetical protein ACREFM_21910, partial [Hypericibacter sp.]
MRDVTNATIQMNPVALGPDVRPAPRFGRVGGLFAALLLALTLGCTPAAFAAMGTDETTAPPESAEQKAVDALIEVALKPWKGDFDGMV